VLRRTYGALVSGALLLAACGDDDGLSPGDDQETADEAIAAVEQALRDDGFAASSDDEDDENDDNLSFQSEDAGNSRRLRSRESDQELPGETARARSGPFDRGTLESTGGVEESVRAGVTFTEEPNNLDSVFEMFTDERFGPCLAEAIRFAFEGGADEGQEAVEVGDVEIEQLGAEGSGMPAEAS
jgi:hypothetical protein